MTRFGLVALLATFASPLHAGAQSFAPKVEVGLDIVGIPAPDRSRVGRGPRFVVNFDARNAMVFTASLQPLGPEGGLSQQETDLYLVAFKRVLHVAGSARVFGTLGGGLERTFLFSPEMTIGNPPIVFPASSHTEVVPAGTVGGGVEVRLGRRAAAVFESAFILSDRLGGRLSAGLVVPIGAYPERAARLDASVPWATLEEGTRAWVTSADGREVTGDVAARSATRLDLRTTAGLVSFAADEVRAIDVTDPLRNGIVRGAKIGGFGAIVPSVLFSLLICAFEETCGAGELAAFNAVIIGLGTGIGAVTGAIADSLRERREPLYRRSGSSSFSIAPMVQRQGAGVGGSIRW